MFFSVVMIIRCPAQHPSSMMATGVVGSTWASSRHRAIFRHEKMSVAVSSNDRDVNKSVRWRNQIGKYILENLV
jgi:hypothetical protein